MLRSGLISMAVMMVLFAGWLMSDDLERPDLPNVIKNIQRSLDQLQSEIKDLKSSVKQLSHNVKDEKHPRVEQPVRTAPTPTSTWERAQEAYDRGKGLEVQKLCGQAIEAFTKAVELDPKNDSAYLHRASCRYNLGNYADAITDVTESLALQPNNSQAYALRASALADSGQTAAALVDAGEAIRRNSTNVDNYLLRASLHQRAGETQPALDDYTQAITMAPQSEKAFLGRAALLRSQGQLVASVKDCYQAIELKPADPAAYLCRAEFYIASGAAQPAISDINQALMNGQNPGQASAMLTAAKQLLENKNAAAEQAPVARPPSPAITGTSSTQPVIAVPAVATAPVAVAGVNFPPAGMPSPGTLPQSPVTQARPASVTQIPVARNSPRQPSKTLDANTLYREGRQYSDEQRFADALPLFDQAIQANPRFTQAYNARCYAHLRLRHYDQAIADCSQAIRLDPSYANAYQNRGVALHFKGDQAGANRDFERKTALEPVAQLQAGKIPAKQ